MDQKLPQGSTSIHHFATHKKGFLRTQQTLSSGLSNGPLPYEVLTYQIPVPLGDCSVHVLLKEGKVMKCFIMDGGDNIGQEKAVNQIKKALEFIRGDLKTISPANDVGKLDAWVVTHWDEDHYVGVMDLATEDKDKGVFSADARMLCGADYNYDGENIKVSEKNKNKIDKIGLAFKAENKHFGKDLVGRDLFTGERIFDGNGDLVPGFNVDGQPRFCCLAADGYGLGVKRMTPSNRNETSILSLLYWPLSKRSSYYTGGDGHPRLADKIAREFLGGGNPMKKDVTVIKLDHHGSSREFSTINTVNKKKSCINMLLHTVPEKVLVTPGADYGHPCWDVIVFLNRWRLGRVEHNKLMEKAPKQVTTPLGKAIEIKTAEQTESPKCKEEECDDEPGAAKEQDGGDFLYTTRDPYWFTKELLAKGDLNITDRRIAAASSLLNQLAPIKADTDWVSERTLLGENFLTLKEETAEPKIKMIDIKDKKHVVQKSEGKEEGTDVKAAEIEDEMNDFEDVKVDQTANHDRIKVQKELDQKQFELLLKHYEDTSPHPAEGPDGSDLSSGNDSEDDDLQDITDMTFLNIVAWDRVSKQKFSKDKKDPYYLLKMSSSDDIYDGNIDILTPDGKPAILPRDNYSGEVKMPRSQSVVLPYHSKKTSDQKNMRRLKKYVIKKPSDKIPNRKPETADKAPEPGMEVEISQTKMRNPSSPAKLGVKKRGRIGLGTGISREKDKEKMLKKTVQDQKPLNLFQKKFIHVKLSEDKIENKDPSTFPDKPNTSHEGQVEYPEESKDMSPKPNTSGNQGKATNLGLSDDQDPFAKPKKKVGGVFNRGRGNNN